MMEDPRTSARALDFHGIVRALGASSSRQYICEYVIYLVLARTCATPAEDVERDLRDRASGAWREQPPRVFEKQPQGKTFDM